jgi:hypothetical protein
MTLAIRIVLAVFLLVLAGWLALDEDNAEELL